VANRAGKQNFLSRLSQPTNQPETAIDKMETSTPHEKFILPGGHNARFQIHITRSRLPESRKRSAVLLEQLEPGVHR